MTAPIDPEFFSPGVERALRTALEAHAGQLRKSAGKVPYVSHPVQVALAIARLGETDEVIQAALLHDVVEDCEGWDLERLESVFGPRVARMVEELTEDKARPWVERKQWAIDHAPDLSREAATIKACDKLHNLASLLADLREAGDATDVWGRFRGGRSETLRMSRNLVDALVPRVCIPLGTTLGSVMAALEAEAG